MKIIVEFDLPDDEFKHKLFINSFAYYEALTGVKEYIRSQLKYKGLTDNETRLLEEIRYIIPDLEY